MADRDLGIRIEAVLVGSALIGPVLAGALLWLGAPVWLVILPVIPGGLWALWAIASVAVAVPIGGFGLFTAIATIFAGIVASWSAGLAVAIVLVALRGYGEAALWVQRRFGLGSGLD